MAKLKTTQGKDVRIVLTKKEHEALSRIIENGWGDGDFRGYGGTDPKLQIRAMTKFWKKGTNQ